MIDDNESAKKITGDGTSGSGSGTSVNSVAGAAAKDNSISIQGVSFSYPLSPDLTVLQDITLNINSRGLVAIAGASGAEVHLVVLIMVYGAHRKHPCLRQARSMSPMSRTWPRMSQQNTGLLSGSVWDNIAYGRRAKEVWRT